MRLPILPALLLPVLLGACAGGKPADDDTDTDVVGVDTDETDLVVDTFRDSDSDVIVDSDTEVPPDTADTDVCEPIALEEVLAVCGGVPTIVSHVSDPVHPGCPDGWQTGAVFEPTVEAALDAAGCERSCVYLPSRSVMVLYCGSRGEYIEWAPGGPGQVGDGSACATQVDVNTVVGSGWYPSWRAYKVANPCPGDTDGTETGDTGVDTAVETDSDVDDTDLPTDSDTDLPTDTDTDLP